MEEIENKYDEWRHIEKDLLAVSYTNGKVEIYDIELQDLSKTITIEKDANLFQLSNLSQCDLLDAGQRGDDYLILVQLASNELNGTVLFALDSSLTLERRAHYAMDKNPWGLIVAQELVPRRT